MEEKERSEDSVTIEPTLLKEFETFCEEVGLSVSSAVTLFMKKTLQEGKIPFEIATNKIGKKQKERFSQEFTQEDMEGYLEEYFDSYLEAKEKNFEKNLDKNQEESSLPSCQKDLVLMKEMLKRMGEESGEVFEELFEELFGKETLNKDLVDEEVWKELNALNTAEEVRLEPIPRPKQPEEKGKKLFPEGIDTDLADGILLEYTDRRSYETLTLAQKTELSLYKRKRMKELGEEAEISSEDAYCDFLERWEMVGHFSNWLGVGDGHELEFEGYLSFYDFIPLQDGISDDWDD